MSRNGKERWSVPGVELGLRAGEAVRVRSAVEILASLDASGTVEGVPFMPEMAAFIGRRLVVHRRAEKTCVEGEGLRAMERTVLLSGARCDGAAHDGCQRACLMFWKEAWLRRADEPTPMVIDRDAENRALAVLAGAATRDGERYLCQSTALARATAPLPRLSFGRLWVDLSHGEITLSRLGSILWRTAANRLLRALKRPEIGALAGPARGMPRGSLALQPGEWVRIKSAEAVRGTLGPDGRNRGLSFEPEMSRYLGGVYQVDYVVSRIILEETGMMTTLANTVALKGLTCQGLCVKNCPRANPLFWREAWLERVEAPAEQQAA